MEEVVEGCCVECGSVFHWVMGLVVCDGLSELGDQWVLHGACAGRFIQHCNGAKQTVDS